MDNKVDTEEEMFMVNHEIGLGLCRVMLNYHISNEVCHISGICTHLFLRSATVMH